MLILRASPMAGMRDDLLVKMSGMLVLGAAGIGLGVLSTLAYPLGSNVQKFICDVFKNYYINNILKKAIQVQASQRHLPSRLNLTTQSPFGQKIIEENAFLCQQVELIQLQSLQQFHNFEGSITADLRKVFEFTVRTKDFYDKYQRICISDAGKCQDYQSKINKYNHILMHSRHSHNKSYPKNIGIILKKIVQELFSMHNQQQIHFLKIQQVLASLSEDDWGFFGFALADPQCFNKELLSQSVIKTRTPKESTNHSETQQDTYPTHITETTE